MQAQNPGLAQQHIAVFIVTAPIIIDFLLIVLRILFNAEHSNSLPKDNPMGHTISLKKHVFLSMFSAATVLTTPALAQVKAEPRPAESTSKPSQKTGANRPGDARKKAMDIGSQPARDLGVAKAEIPAALQKAYDAPYGLKDLDSCKAIEAEIASLNEALGPDFDAGDKPKSGPGKMAEEGGKILVGSIIPFCGLVRQVSGAASADRRLEKAVTTGVARRGFLRGVRAAKGCETPR